MEKGTPFENFHSDLGNMFEVSISKQSAVLEKGLKKVFDDILEDYDLNFVVVESPDSQRDELKERVKEFVKYANAHADGPITIELARAKEC